MLNFKTFLGPHYWFGGHDFTNKSKNFTVLGCVHSNITNCDTVISLEEIFLHIFNTKSPKEVQSLSLTKKYLRKIFKNSSSQELQRL